MKLKLIQIPDKSERFNSTQSGVFLTQKNFNLLAEKLSLGEYGIVCAKVESQEILSKFIIYCILTPLAVEMEGDKDKIFIHKELIPDDLIDNGKLEVEVIPFKLDKLPYATEVIIHLPEKDVQLWSDDEVEHAITSLAAKNYFLKKEQTIWVVPKTKQKVKGKVEKAKDNSNNFLDDIFLINSDTKFVLKGLPDKRQKILEFNEIGGLDETIIRLREIIQLPLNYPELFERFNIKPYRGILLYGPPGNGKTMIAKSLAYSLGAKFFPIEGAELMSKYVSVGEKELRKIFEDAEDAGNSIIFIDELDAIAADRSGNTEGYEVRYVTTLLR